jgi:hypothetical protein
LCGKGPEILGEVADYGCPEPRPVALRFNVEARYRMGDRLDGMARRARQGGLNRDGSRIGI